MSEHVALGKSIINKEEKTISYQLDNLYAYNENLEDEFGNNEIIGTSYWNEAMPFIRYKTQDFGKIDSNGFIKSLDGRGQTFLSLIHISIRSRNITPHECQDCRDV